MKRPISGYPSESALSPGWRPPLGGRRVRRARRLGLLHHGLMRPVGEAIEGAVGGDGIAIDLQKMPSTRARPREPRARAA